MKGSSLSFEVIINIAKSLVLILKNMNDQSKSFSLMRENIHVFVSYCIYKNVNMRMTRSAIK